jgi:hypothetical protein
MDIPHREPGAGRPAAAHSVRLLFGCGLVVFVKEPGRLGAPAPGNHRESVRSAPWSRCQRGAAGR